MNENFDLNLLDLLTIASFVLQITQINNNNKHMQEIENKLDYIIQTLHKLNKERTDGQEF